MLPLPTLRLRIVMRNCIFPVVFRSVHRILIYERSQLRIGSKFIPQISVRRNASGGKTLPFESEIKVSKDVLLFRYEKPRFFRMLVFFAVAQFTFWIYLSWFTFTSLRDVSKQQEEAEFAAAFGDKHPKALSWWKAINLGENKYRNGISLLCFSLGYVIVSGCWMYSARTVRTLTLLKGGSNIQITTYAPFWGKNALTVPLEQVTCQTGREQPGSQLPLKIKNKPLYYLLNKNGEFTNTRLFDYTAGIKRVWRK